MFTVNSKLYASSFNLLKKMFTVIIFLILVMISLFNENINKGSTVCFTPNSRLYF